MKLLRQRAQSLSAALDNVRCLEEEYASKRQELSSSDRLSKQHQATLLTLQTWTTYCEVGAPILAASLERARTVVSETRVALAGTSPDDVHEVPVEYAARGLREAIQAATENLALAKQQEQSGADSLLQRERSGQLLTQLRSELRVLVQVIVDRTGDALHCPVCGTIHLDRELLYKLDELGATDDPTLTDGLRQAVQIARERALRERDALATLRALRRFAEVSDPAGTATVNELMQRLVSNHSVLSDAVVELARLEFAAESLDLFGADWAGYADAQAAASALLGFGADLADLQIVNARVAVAQKDIEAANKAISEARANLMVLSNQASAAAVAAGLPNIDGSSPKEISTAIQRAVGLFDTALVFLGEAAQLVTLRDDQTLETLQQAIDEAMNAFDRAQHAERAEVSARSELSTKTNELHDATAQLRLAAARQENLTKAIDVLSEVVEKHSLEKATQNALESIRGHVSDIFARIHSPAEYILGDFNGEQLLTTRDGLRAHGVSQVSTGQRAALALSIFLALNRSAGSAPPVLLIDDPVAHIDDLNSLSFLDYLRDLAVGTRKQIFFATADAKLAALFQRKFEFLGPERFKKIVLSR